MRPWEAEGFDWATERVVQKLAERNIRQFEVEEVFWNGAAYKSNAQDKTGDWKMIGFTNRQRALTVVLLTMDEERLLRVITAWPSADSEIEYLLKRRK